MGGYGGDAVLTFKNSNTNKRILYSSKIRLTCQVLTQKCELWLHQTLTIKLKEY